MDIGPLNLMIPMTAFAGVLTYIWPFVHNKGSIITIAVLYGFVHIFSHPALIHALLSAIVSLPEHIYHFLSSRSWPWV